MQDLDSTRDSLVLIQQLYCIRPSFGQLTIFANTLRHFIQDIGPQMERKSLLDMFQNLESLRDYLIDIVNHDHFKSFQSMNQNPSQAIIKEMCDQDQTHYNQWRGQDRHMLFTQVFFDLVRKTLLQDSHPFFLRERVQEQLSRRKMRLSGAIFCTIMKLQQEQMYFQVFDKYGMGLLPIGRSVPQLPQRQEEEIREQIQSKMQSSLQREIVIQEVFQANEERLEQMQTEISAQPQPQRVIASQEVASDLQLQNKPKKSSKNINKFSQNKRSKSQVSKTFKKSEIIRSTSSASKIYKFSSEHRSDSQAFEIPKTFKKKKDNSLSVESSKQKRSNFMHPNNTKQHRGNQPVGNISRQNKNHSLASKYSEKHRIASVIKQAPSIPSKAFQKKKQSIQRRLKERK